MTVSKKGKAALKANTALTPAKGKPHFFDAAKRYTDAQLSNERATSGILADMVAAIKECRIALREPVLKTALSDGGRLHSEVKGAVRSVAIHKDDLWAFLAAKGEKPKEVRVWYNDGREVTLVKRKYADANRIVNTRVKNLREALIAYVNAGGATKKGATPRQNDPSCVVDCAALMKVRAKATQAKSDPEKAQGYGDIAALLQGVDAAIAAFPAEVQKKAKAKK